MPRTIKIGDILLRVGDKLRSTDAAFGNGICPPGRLVTVNTINEDNDEVVVGLYSSRRISDWGTLDDRVPNKQGLWANRDCIIDNFEPLRNDHVITGDETHRGRSLKGMACTVLHVDGTTGNAFVELDEDIGGNSADGIGKKGHCTVVNKNSVEKSAGYRKASRWRSKEE